MQRVLMVSAGRLGLPLRPRTLDTAWYTRPRSCTLFSPGVTVECTLGMKDEHSVALHCHSVSQM